MSNSRLYFNRLFSKISNPDYLIDYPYFHYIFKGSDGLPKTVNVVSTMMKYMIKALKNNKKVWYFNYYGIWSSFMNSTEHFYIATISPYKPKILIPHVNHVRYKNELKLMYDKLQKIQQPENKFVSLTKCTTDVLSVIYGLYHNTKNENIDMIIDEYMKLMFKCHEKQK